MIGTAKYFIEHTFSAQSQSWPQWEKSLKIIQHLAAYPFNHANINWVFTICESETMGGPKVNFLSAKGFVKANLYGPGCHRVVTCDMNSMSAYRFRR